MTLATIPLLPELLTWFALLFGVGWYGSPTNPPIASDFIYHSIANSVAPTLLSSITIPANTVSGLQILKYDVTGYVIQSTGVNQNSPTITVSIAGSPVFTSAAAVVLPNNGFYYMFRLSILILPQNGATSNLDCYTWFEIGQSNNLGNAGPELLRQKATRALVFTPAQANTLDVTVTNALASVNYSTTITMAQLIAS